MKAYTSRNLFDERDRFTGVGEQMGQVRLDSEANLQSTIVRTDASRRTEDVVEGSPDDGFRITDTHLLDPVLSLDGWSAVGLDADDDRLITPQLRLVRRDADTLPHVLRTRGHTAVTRRCPGIDLLRLPVPLHPEGTTYAAAALVLQVRFDRPPTDDEDVAVRVVVLDADGAEHDVGPVPVPDAPDAVQDAVPWTQVRVPLADLAPLRRGAGGDESLVLTGWGLSGLPPRANVDLDALLAVDGGLGEDDLVVRGGDGTVTGAGRLFVRGRRVFLEHDWRYSLQPDLPDPTPLVRPVPAGDGTVDHHLVYLDVFDEVVRGFEDPAIIELALGGEETSYRIRQVTQVRAVQVESGDVERLASPTGGGRLTTNVAAGSLPDRFPAEDADPCRDRCLSTVNATTGDGYRGSLNVNVRVEVLAAPDGGAPGIVGWSRDNAAHVVPLVVDAVAGAESVFVAPEDARAFTAGGMVVVEDRRSRLDPDRPEHRAQVRALRSVNSATGELELEPTGWTLTTDPVPLVLGGGLGRPFLRTDAAAVRRWDGVDHLLTGVRYNLVDGIDFALSGDDFRTLEHWTFTARVAGPDAVAEGVVEQLTEAPVAGPRHTRVPLARVTWTATGREIEDLRARYLPLHEVRDRLVELGARKLAPGAFTVVVGDGRRTFGDIDQDLAEGVTGDEALQAALDRLGAAGGAVYVRAGEYRLEHPVLIQNRSMVRILGDGAATRLLVTGAGGAFHVDGCGADGEISMELLALAETPDLETPIGSDAARARPIRPLGPIVPLPAVPDVRPVRLDDLFSAVPTAPDLVVRLAQRLRGLGPLEGRAAGSVVATLAQLRRLQRAEPGRPLENVAPDELDVLRRLPHGVVTVTDSRRVRLAHLTITSREQGQADGLVSAAVLVSGSCSDLTVDDCRMTAPAGVVAAPYARFLTPAAITLWPRSGLFLSGLAVRDCVVEASGEATHGVRVADGVIDGVVVTGNRISGFGAGIAVEDAAEVRTGEAVDRTVVRDNVVVAAETGVRVVGDGVDVEANEVRLGSGPDPAGAGVRAGVHVTGASCRVRDNWIALDDRPAPALSVQAGVVIGTAVDGGGRPGRPVLDVSVVGNRVDGGGAQGCGVLVGGSTPCLDVLVQGNTLRALGDAGVRAWASSGPVGRLRVEDNTIEDVARDYLSWGPSVVAEAQALTASVLPPNGTPRDVLDVLVGAGGAVLAALDAVLRWLDRATLRGGVVLSLVEDSEVRGNRIREVGRTAYPAGFGRPGAAIRTAGVAAVGTRGLVVSGNQVRGVRTPAVLTQPVVPITPIRPAILDLLPVLVRPGTRGRVADVFAPAVALRHLVMEYAAGTARIRQRLGRSIYGAIEALSGTLSEGGPGSQRLGLELQGGLARMLEAQGTEDHTLAAHHVRATLSRAAALTAVEPDVALAWDAAARFDAALAGEDDRDTLITSAADEVLGGVPALLAGLEGLGVDAEGEARTVLAAAGTAATKERARSTLAASLGTLAEARSRKVLVERSAGVGALTTTDRAAAEGIVNLALAALDVPDLTALNEQAVERVAEGGAGLTQLLRGASTPLADRVGADIARLRAAGARPTRADVMRLTGTLREVQAFTRGEQVVHGVERADLDAQQQAFNASLIAVTADQIERRVAALEVDAEPSATRNLTLIEQAASQLTSLVGSAPQARATARAAKAALGDAVTDVEHRAEHQARARSLLEQLAAAQGMPVAGTTAPEPASPTEAEPPLDLAQAVAGLGELVLVLRDTGQPAEIREEAGALLESRIRSVADAAGVGAGERTELLDDLATTVGDARSGAASARAAAAHALAAKVEAIAYRAVQRPEVSPEVAAVHVLSGGLARALDPARPEATRLSDLAGWTTARGDALSTSLADRLRSALDLSTALSDLKRGLDQVLAIPDRSIVLPAQRLTLDAETADGAFVSGAGRVLDLRDNDVADCRVGLTVLGRDAHALAPDEDSGALVLGVHRNVVEAAALAAVEVSVPSASASVVGNAATGCCGVVDRTPAGYGQAVLSVTGSGALVVADNQLRDNGNARSDVPVHEVLLDWDGDVTVRGNVVRHAGSSAGGHGVAVVSGAVAADVVRSLVASPALVVEPAAATGPVLRPPLGVLTGLDDVLSAGLTGIAKGPLTGAAGTAGLGIGGLRLATRELRPSFGVLDASPTLPVTTLAQSAADSWAAAVTRAPLAVTTNGRLLEWLRTRQPPRIVLRPPARRSVQVVGNDVIAAGPALVVLHEGAALVSATVADNELESLGAAGAVYLRGVDTTVVSGNRLECRREVNVAVVRARTSLVTLTGNSAAGAQPTVPPAPPVPVDVKPIGPGFGDLHLAVPVGERGSLAFRLDPEALLSAVEAKRSSAFVEVAEEAEVSFGHFARARDLVLDPEVASVLTASTRSGLAFRAVADRIEAVARPAREAEMTLDLDLGAAGSDPGHAVAPPPADHVEKAVLTTNSILASKSLSAPAKLFGLATSSGMPAHQARAFVRSNLVRAGGDETAALATGLSDITGVGADLGGPTLAERAQAANPVEDIVSLLLRNRAVFPLPHDRFSPVQPVAPRPDPRRSSLVVVGGSRVVAVGNATTAGVHVHDAAHSVENNV